MDRVLNLELVFAVEGAGRFVQHQHGRTAQQRPRRAIRCRSPPESRTPRSPTTVSSPCGRAATNRSAAAHLSASHSSSSLADGLAASGLAQDGVVQQECVLADIADVLPPTEREVASEQPAVDADVTGVGDQQSQQHVRQSALAGRTVRRWRWCSFAGIVSPASRSAQRIGPVAGT